MNVRWATSALRNIRPARAAVALAVTTFAIYANSLRNGFTIDDSYIYADNHFIRHWANVRYLFTPDYFRFSNEASYRPVSTLSYFFDAWLWPSWPGGPHLTGILIYIGIVLMALRLFEDILGDRMPAFLGAALFAVHPVHTEVISTSGFREDLLATFFALSSWLLYRASARPSRRFLMAPAVLSFAAAVFAKESAIVYPALAGVLDWCGATRRRWRPSRTRVLLYYGGLVAVAALFAALRFGPMRFGGEGTLPPLGGSLLGTLLADVRIQARYLALLVWPHPLVSFYPPSAYSPRVDAVWVVSAAVLAAVAAAVIVFRRNPVLVAAGLWWFIGLAPVSNLYPLFNPMAERYVFLSSVGACLWFGTVLAAACRSRWRLGLCPLTAAVLGMFAGLVVARNPVWRDDVALWGRMVERMPRSVTVLSNLASGLYARGDYAGAERAARTAMELDGSGGEASQETPLRVVLGCAAFMRGDLDAALAEFVKAERRLPCRFDIDAAVHRNIGLIHDERGNLERAAVSYGRAAAIDPFRADVWRKLSFCHLRLGRRADAESGWERARRLDPAIPPFAEIVALYERSRGASP